jgi:hypothetical protein
MRPRPRRCSRLANASSGFAPTLGEALRLAKESKPRSAFPVAANFAANFSRSASIRTNLALIPATISRRYRKIPCVPAQGIRFVAAGKFFMGPQGNLSVGQGIIFRLGLVQAGGGLGYIV